MIDHTAIARRFTLAAMVAAWLQPNFCMALPPADDIPEEILRTEIILEGRSLVNGKPLSAAEYESQKAQLAQTPFNPELNSDIQQIIFLLQIRKFIKTVIPFY